MFPFTTGNYIKKVRSVRPDRLVELWPQNEPVGHGISTGVIRGYHGAYTNVTLGQPGLPGSGLTSAGYNGATSFNNIYTTELANDQLLGNPGFETAGAGDPDFWAIWAEEAGDGVLANEVGVKHQGADACKMTTGVGLTIYVSNDWVSVPNTTYRVRFWTRGDGANSGLCRVWDVTNTVYITDLIDTGITAAAYGAYEFTVTAPAGCVSMRLYLHGADVNGAVTYFDACEVRRVDGFLGDVGTIIVPARVANVGVWTDGTGRRMVRIAVGANNYVGIGRTVANNTIGFDYAADGTAEVQATGALTNVDFAIYGMTWDISAGADGEVRYYIDGVASGAMDTALGTWIGDLSNTDVVIGAASTVPAAVWSGDIGPVALWSDALSPDEMRYLG